MSKEELLKYLIAEIDLIMHDKDYRFENANGTWYSRESCRDLTNEEVFEELRTELRQLADLEAKLLKFAHRISDQNEEILELKQQLAEKDELLRQKIEKMKSTDFIKMCIKSGYVVEAKENDNQTAIRELEKVKGFLLEKIAEKQSCFDSGNYSNFAYGVKTICEIMLISIDKQINSLKGENK